ncbi:hypothetical protein [Sphingomonas flavescens]|uniref:hypothetical protein n=1 Tax=Sphingomonas flavescens TaxID=3132797 RepID=UPI002803B286|nr:hypothetical protein [Sphingomonas limnosediminicola]
MDPSDHYQRHQISLFRADQIASSEELRRIHRELAEGYASRISATKSSFKLAAA